MSKLGKGFLPPYIGSAYYPESWDREEIDKDLEQMISHGLNAVRIAEFAWSTIEPKEGVYDLSLFREVVDKCKNLGIAVVMCTPSATPPAWMAHKYPEIFMKDGNTMAHHGYRRVTCPTNRTYRNFCNTIVDVLAKEFADDENIIGWQIDNEFNVMNFNTGCDCQDCTEGFRNFLHNRYHGSIKELNDAWGNYTWSLNYNSFDEIGPFLSTQNQPPVHKYMWDVYKTEAFADFCSSQAKIIHKYTDKPVGTDMMPTHQFDPYTANKELDVAQLNCYSSPTQMQFWSEVYRSQKDRHLWVTETSTCWNGGNKPNGVRKKGFCTANTLLPFAAGSEMVLYWLFRSHMGGYEMSHGSVVDSWGRDMPCSDEVRTVTATIENLTPMVRGTLPVKSKMAITFTHLPYVMDKYSSMETAGMHCDYTTDILSRIYVPLLRAHYRPDVISAYAELSSYRLLISHRQMTLDEGDFLDKILPWVEAGGTWVVGPYSDILTPDLAKYKNGPYGHLEEWAGITRKYYVPAPNATLPGMSDPPLPAVCFADGIKANVVNNLSFDAIVPGENVKVLASYGSGEYLEGYAAITETKRGKGRVIVLGAQITPADYLPFIKKIADECGIVPITEGSECVITNLLEGEYGTVFTAIEVLGICGNVVAPFDCEDINTGEQFSKGQLIDMPAFRAIFAKKL